MFFFWWKAFVIPGANTHTSVIHGDSVDIGTKLLDDAKSPEPFHHILIHVH